VHFTLFISSPTATDRRDALVLCIVPSMDFLLRLLMCFKFAFFAILQAPRRNLMGLPRYISMSAYLRPALVLLLYLKHTAPH